MRMLDLFCGRLGWSKAFLARGWECVGVDLVEPPKIPRNFRFIKETVLNVRVGRIGLEFDFICASPPCEQFSVHGMKHFHPNPPYPEHGLKLFNHTRAICEESRIPYVMENVRAAQQFVGRAVHHCGPFYLWGTGVPMLLHQGITKGRSFGNTDYLMSLSPEDRRAERRKLPSINTSSKSKGRKAITDTSATIPPELANCVADYAERLIGVNA